MFRQIGLFSQFQPPPSLQQLFDVGFNEGYVVATFASPTCRTNWAGKYLFRAPTDRQRFLSTLRSCKCFSQDKPLNSDGMGSWKFRPWTFTIPTRESSIT